MTSPSVPVPGTTRATLWVLRVVAGLQAVMLVAQPLLAGRFLEGDYAALGMHGGNGIALMGVSWLVVIAAILTWRPGRLSGWPIGLSVAAALVIPVQIGMGFERALGVHLLMGVGLVAAGVVLAIWAWAPDRARRSYRARAPQPYAPVPAGAAGVAR